MQCFKSSVEDIYRNNLLMSLLWDHLYCFYINQSFTLNRCLPLLDAKVIQLQSNYFFFLNVLLAPVFHKLSTVHYQ